MPEIDCWYRCCLFRIGTCYKCITQSLQWQMATGYIQMICHFAPEWSSTLKWLPILVGRVSQWLQRPDWCQLSGHKMHKFECWRRCWKRPLKSSEKDRELRKWERDGERERERETGREEKKEMAALLGSFVGMETADKLWIEACWQDQVVDLLVINSVPFTSLE